MNARRSGRDLRPDPVIPQRGHSRTPSFPQEPRRGADGPGQTASEGTWTMEKLSLILWRERELLESLLFKLESEQLILASGNTRWLGRAAEEVEALVEQIRETEVLRAIAADAAAEQAGLAAHSSLRSLAEAC